MQILSLNGNWHLETIGGAEQIPAKVPGSVYSGLLTAGKIPDPFFRDNEMKVLPLMEHDYRYTRKFEDRKSTRLNSSHPTTSRMPSSA